MGTGGGVGHRAAFALGPSAGLRAVVPAAARDDGHPGVPAGESGVRNDMGAVAGLDPAHVVDGDKRGVDVGAEWRRGPDDLVQSDGVQLVEPLV